MFRIHLNHIIHHRLAHLALLSLKEYLLFKEELTLHLIFS